MILYGIDNIRDLFGPKVMHFNYSIASTSVFSACPSYKTGLYFSIAIAGGFWSHQEKPNMSAWNLVYRNFHLLV